MNLVHRFGLLFGASAVGLLAGCMVGPDYQRAGAPVPVTYKELAPMPDGWKAATPNDAADRGPWWSIYQDPLLNELEEQVSIDNQNLKAYEASFRQALAVAGEARSNLLPAIFLPDPQQSTAVPGVARSHKNGVTTTSGTAVVGASWDLDLWGRIRRQVEGEQAAAQA